ncbi:MAG: hypothetical protein AB9873_15785 [Syntrophobacteraceae bacterium]
MTRANLCTMELPEVGDYRVSYVYESPCLKILKFRFEAGQRLFMYSDEMQGKVSLYVLGGNGEFEGEGLLRYSVEPGDLVISEITEQNSLLATSELSLLVTVTASRPVSCEMDSESRSWS